MNKIGKTKNDFDFTKAKVQTTVLCCRYCTVVFELVACFTLKDLRAPGMVVNLYCVSLRALIITTCRPLVVRWSSLV